MSFSTFSAFSPFSAIFSPSFRLTKKHFATFLWLVLVSIASGCIVYIPQLLADLKGDTVKLFYATVAAFVVQIIIAPRVGFAVMGAMLAYGRNDEKAGSAFGETFKSRPWTGLGLMVNLCARIVVWMLPCVFLLFMAAYCSTKSPTASTIFGLLGVTYWTYVFFNRIYAWSLAWFVAADNPKRTTCWCFSRSAQLMQGHKLSLCFADGFYIMALGCVSTLVTLAVMFATAIIHMPDNAKEGATLVLTVFGIVYTLMLFFVAIGLTANRIVVYETVRKAEAESKPESEDEGLTGTTYVLLTCGLAVAVLLAVFATDLNNLGRRFKQKIDDGRKETVAEQPYKPRQQTVEEDDKVEVVMPQADDDENAEYMLVDGHLVRIDGGAEKKAPTVKKKANDVSEMKAGESVDLGLSVLWCSTNVGATGVGDAGKLLTWDEAKGADGWRLPTFDEQRELIMQCSWKFCNVKGADGYKVTGPNGNSIFLPAAGYIKKGELRNKGTHGYFWATAGDMGGPTKAQYMFYIHRDVNPTRQGIIERNVSLSVRLVRAK